MTEPEQDNEPLLLDPEKSTEPDIAFLKGLVEAGGARTQRLAGLTFIWGGSLYAAQCFITYCMILWAPVAPAWSWWTVGFLPTVIFLAFCGWLMFRHGMKSQGTASNRAINAAFQATGIANIAMICIFLPAAMRYDNFHLWLYYPAVVCAIQGAAWMVAWQLRRHLWLFCVGMGWMISAVALGWLVGTSEYLLVCGLALTLFMVLPGITLMRLAQSAE